MKKLVYKLITLLRICLQEIVVELLLLKEGYIRRKGNLYGGVRHFYTYTLNVPYIEDPFYDGEFNTNRILGVYASFCKTGTDR